jgi:predicted RND superfamily exporter protein
MLDDIIHFQENHPWLVLTIFLSLTIAMIPGMQSVETIVALENMMPASSEPVQAFNDLRDLGLGKDTVAIKLTAGTEDNGVNSLVDDKARTYTEALSERLRRVEDITAAQPLHKTGFVDEAKRTGVLIAQTGVGDNGEQMSRVFNDIQEATQYDKPEGIQTTITGVPAVQQRLADMVQTDKNLTTLISLILVFLLTLALFRGSITAAVMPIIVVLLSIVWLYGTMGYLGIPLSTLAGSVAALVIGIGIDYAVHILNTYRYHRRHGESMRNALDKAVGQTGVAILATSITTISAFLAFLTGAMPEMHRFGLIMAIGIAYALIFSFLLLPAIFIIEEQLTHNVYNALKERFNHET